MDSAHWIQMHLLSLSFRSAPACPFSTSPVLRCGPAPSLRIEVQNIAEAQTLSVAVLSAGEAQFCQLSNENGQLLGQAPLFIELPASPLHPFLGGCKLTLLIDPSFDVLFRFSPHFSRILSQITPRPFSLLRAAPLNKLCVRPLPAPPYV